MKVKSESEVAQSLAPGNSPLILSWWDGSKAAETRVPSGPETQSEAERASDSSGTGRRQLICMLNIWK